MTSVSPRVGWGPSIRRARLEAGRTQADVAAGASVSLRTVGALERGDVVPQAGVLEAVLDELGLRWRPSSDPEVVVALLEVAPLLEAVPVELRGEAVARVGRVLVAVARGE